MRRRGVVVAAVAIAVLIVAGIGALAQTGDYAGTTTTTTATTMPGTVPCVPISPTITSSVAGIPPLTCVPDLSQSTGPGAPPCDAKGRPPKGWTGPCSETIE